MYMKRQLVSLLTKRAIHYMRSDPVNHFDKVIKIARAITKGREPFYQGAINGFDRFWHNEKSPWRGYLMKFLTELDPKQRDKICTNFLVNDSIVGFTQQNKNVEKYGCSIPWAILMDPTSACNLKCTGCWAAEYSKQNNLTLAEMDDIIRQGKKLGCYFYIYSGGEPLMRKDDLIKLCDMHPDCFFSCFTNGTLIDDQFAQELKRVGNFLPAISIEGIGEATDMRRGSGTFDKVAKAMAILKKNHLAFGFSCCYHSKNIDAVASDEFIDFLIDQGAWFGWYFTYMPVGADAHTELMVNPEQRAYMYKRVHQIRSTKPLFVIDFWNDGEYVNGCIAGGRRYLHINSAGDAEPCAFIHYSTCNIREKSLLEILHSPLFMAYHKGQPFNKNLLRPCPLLDNPSRLAEMVKASKAHSTEALSPENVDSLTAKCKEPAEAWAKKSDEIWNAKFGGKGKSSDKEKEKVNV